MQSVISRGIYGRGVVCFLSIDMTRASWQGRGRANVIPPNVKQEAQMNTKMGVLITLLMED